MTKPKISLKPVDLVVIISLLFIGLATYYLAVPQASRLKELTSERKSKEAEEQRLKQRIDDLFELASSLASHKDGIDRLEVAFPKDEQVVEAMIQAQTMIERSGLAIVNLAPSKSKDGNLPVAMSVKGSYTTLNALLRELYRNLRPILVKSLAIVPERDKEQNVGQLSISLNTVFRHSPVSSPAPSPQASSEPLPKQ